ncbi:16S rRNA (adenine(1518)-N(6)/adenine(1519)-N(6))-dimethyltransferase RsmA [Pseudochelatococcus contaminans]|uniref:Ribosomal RNA small subunit methyltransferase A n=1 Tax=Pseudochelatococcus contaminans TaxID=1538103 RepID=A0A7W6EI93_9HYPH|nr:16S rRNA (adenine(1518)-N(6)/adenine(1519)-N(6))-dimethyltransferase RsmA [Pseudochelatococcus contaminans]MBB3810828.1 16S rRNA (adenine1518-N6/adenine1519-N6)-dimethyltransferase [Pseudochelatococcus contaminans]
MSQIDDLPPLRDIVRQYELAAKKSLGQNFLFDLNLTAKIARSSGPLENVTVVEVGPGPGGLTRALLACGARHVIAIERDSRCLPILAQISGHYPGRLTVIEGDALTVDLSPYLNGDPARVVANLPYNVATPLLTGWLTTDPWPSWWESLTLMFQREVAERIVATPAEPKDYGRLGVLCGWRTYANILFDVPPSAFVPPPKVTSSIVHLAPRPAPTPARTTTLATVTQAAFGQRRKMLRQSLKSLDLSNAETDVAGMIQRAGLEETARAEEIPVDGFVRLANVYDELVRNR